MSRFVVVGLTLWLALFVGQSARGQDHPSAEGLQVSPSGCATGAELDDYLVLRQALVAERGDRAGLGAPNVTAMGGLIVLEDDGTFTDDNGGSVWDLDQARLEFVPVGGSPGSFDATRTAASLDTNEGTLEVTFNAGWSQHQIDLPFTFPFGSDSFTTLYVTSDFGIFFESQSSNTSGFQYSQNDLSSNTPPRITPLLRDSDWIWADIVDLYVRIDSTGGNRKVVITFHEQSSRPESQPHLDRRFQTTLFEDGTIRMDYPDAESFCTFGAVQVIANGGGGASFTDLSTLDDTPTQVRFVREAFTFPTLLPFSVESFINSQYGLDDLNLDALAIYQNFFTEITFFAGAYHTNGRPGVTGIGNDGERRTSLLHMNQINLSWNFRDNGSKVSVLNHELGHRWLFFIDGVGSSRAGAHPAQNAHLPAPFTWFTNVDSSCMGGTTWIDNMDGSFTSQPFRTYYSFAWLELYLMGLASPSEVLDWYWIDDAPSLNGPYYPPVDSTYTGTRIDLDIDDVISANGARDPAYPATQNEFDVAFVLLVRPENPATDSDLANVREKMDIWIDSFGDSVNDRASLETELPEIVGTGAEDCNFNGLDDADEVTAGTAFDCNGNLVLDECENYVTIVLTPLSTTVSPGGTLEFDAVVTNNTASAVMVDGWLDAFKPDGSPFGGNPIAGPKNANLPAGQQISRRVSLPIPAGTPTPSGPFRIQGSLGGFPDCFSSVSDFEFNVE